MKIGRSIKIIREKRGMLQQDLAEKANLAQNVISRIERDVHQPKHETLTRIADALEVPQDVFYYYELLNSSKDEPKFRKVHPELSKLISDEIDRIFDLS